MTYERCKKLIQNGSYEQEDMLKKLDVFLLADRITTEQYNELVSMMEKRIINFIGRVKYGWDK